MKKHFILTSLVAIAMSCPAVAATDVTFGGAYNNGASNIADGVADTTYDYVKSDGTTATDIAYNSDPVLTDFTYTDKDGNLADLSTGTPVQSDFVGTTAADGVNVKSVQEIVSGATASRDNYTYVNGAGDEVTLGEVAQDMKEVVALDATYTGGTSIDVVNGTAGEFNGTLYTVEDSGYVYHLSADGTKLVDDRNVNVTPTAGSALETEFNNMVAAYNADKANIVAAEGTTTANKATEDANWLNANGIFTTDSNKIAELNGYFETVGVATDALAAAQAAQQVAADAYVANSELFQAAKDVYDAPILEAITNGANEAIDGALAEGGAIRSELDVNATAIADNKTAIESEVARATAAEIELDGKIAQNTSAIEEEVANRIAGDAMTLDAAKAYVDSKNELALKSAYDYTDRKVDALEDELSAGIASAAAMSSVAVSGVGRGEVSVGGGYGYYNSQSAIALGAAMGLTDNWSVNAAAGLADSNVTFRAGTNYKFKLF